MAAPRVVVGFHSYGTCPTMFALDLARAMRFSGTMVPFAHHEQSCYVDSARNKIVRGFLQSDGTHLLMVDVDISFEADAFLKTFAILEANGADVLYGNYALGNSGNSIFAPPENIHKEAAVLVGLEHGRVYDRVATGGTGWVMIRRSLLERMQRECPGPWHWFPRLLTHDGSDFRGEDISFGLRVWEMKPRPKILATTSLLLRHIKNQPFIPAFQQAAAAEAKLNALCFPNPYESDKDKYLIVNNMVIEKDKITPQQLAEIEERLREEKERTKKDAESVRVDEGQVRGGGGGGLPEVQRGTEQGSGDLQLPAPGSTGGGEEKEKEGEKGEKHT